MKQKIRVPAGILAEDQKRRFNQEVSHELAKEVDQEMFLLLMKKRGVFKTEAQQDLFRAVAPYLPCEEIIEIYHN